MSSADVVFKNGLARAYKDGHFSDFTITCGPRTFKVHKVIVSAQSDYFFTVCAKGFKEGEDNRIDLKTSDTDPACDDPEAIACMVEFFYYQRYEAERIDLRGAPPQESLKPPTQAQQVQSSDDDPWSRKRVRKQRAAMDWDFLQPVPKPEPLVGADDWWASVEASTRSRRQVTKTVALPANPKSCSDGNLVVHARVFAAAVKYQIPALRSQAVANFRNAVDENCSHESFARAILIVYTTTPEDARELRDIVAEALTTRRKLLDVPDVGQVVRGINGLAYDLLRKIQGLPAIVGDSEPLAGT